MDIFLGCIVYLAYCTIDDSTQHLSKEDQFV
jgi:hypothetical protein